MQKPPVPGMTAIMAYRSLSRWSGTLGVCAIVAVVRPAHAEPRAVVELFTSQGCSSCPPADKILGELAKDPSVIALSMPIDYWDYLGWKDTLADSRFSARQKAYSQMRGDRDVYTPQVDRQRRGACASAAIARASKARSAKPDKRDGVMSVPVTMTVSGKQINVSVAAASDTSPAQWRGLDLRDHEGGADRDRHAARTAGSEVTYHNVVRNLAQGRRLERQCRQAGRCRWRTSTRDGVDAAAVYVQDGNRDKPGPMLGAAITSLH